MRIMLASIAATAVAVAVAEVVLGSAGRTAAWAYREFDWHEAA